MVKRSVLLLSALSVYQSIFAGPTPVLGWSIETETATDRSIVFQTDTARAIDFYRYQGANAGYREGKLWANGNHNPDELQRILFDESAGKINLLSGAVEFSLDSSQGDKPVLLEIQSRPSTGYIWQYLNSAGELATQGQGSETLSSDVRLGAPSTQTFLVDPAKLPGGLLVYRRPFEAGAPIRSKLRIAPQASNGNPEVLRLVSPNWGSGSATSGASSSTISGSAQMTVPLTSVAALPTSYDSRTQNLIPAIRDQGACGDCWAFGTAGAMEVALIKAGASNNSIHLSEQFLLSCNNDGYSCDGGWWAHKYHYDTLGKSQSTIGAVLYSDFPYYASQVTCPTIANHPYRASGWSYVNATAPYTVAATNDIKSAIMTYGAVATAVCADSGWSSYHTGVYSPTSNACGSGEVNHAVMLIGWDDATSSWLVRNQWGSSWGNAGYMQIAYDPLGSSSKVGYAASYISYPSTTSQYTVSVSKTGSGTITSYPSGINCGTNCSSSLSAGTNLSLFETPGSGYVFKGWGGDCTGTSSCNLTMNANKAVTATFTAKTRADFNLDGRSDVLWRNGATGQAYFWYMNGTGAYQGAVAGGSNVPMDWVIQATGDFNNDGYADLLWRNQTSGEVAVWLMNSASKLSEATIGTVNDFSWQPTASVGDLNGDGRDDVVWRHGQTGQVYVWLMNGVSAYTGLSAGSTGLEWQIQSVGDFDGDGKADLFWRNQTTGQAYVWLMNGATQTSGGPVGTVSDFAWQPFHQPGDLNGDGKADIIWRHGKTGEVFVWFMNGTSPYTGSSAGTVSLDWIIRSIGDYNGDGKSDLFWRNESSGQAYVWLMNGASKSSEGGIGTVSDFSWQVFGPRASASSESAGGPLKADFNGDGRADVLWRHARTGEVYLWLMNGTGAYSGVSAGTVGLDWVIRSVGDFNGDGKADLFWRNQTTGQAYVWLMNGASKLGEGAIGTVADFSWKPLPSTGDFNGDGKADLIWRHGMTGEVFYWFMNGISSYTGSSGGTSTLDWVVRSIGDYSGDGKADVFWWNETSGQAYVATSSSSGVVGTVTDFSWQPMTGAGDFNADGRADLAWRHGRTGEVALWLMNGTSPYTGVSVSSVSLDWSIRSIGDYNNDGKSDLFWRNNSTGQAYVWLMNGTSKLGEGAVGTVADFSWQPFGHSK